MIILSFVFQLPVGPVVAASPMSRSPADERQHNFQQLQQQMQSTSPATGHLNKPLHQQFTANNTVSLIPAGTVGAGGAVNYKQQQQQQFVVTSANSASNSNVLLGGVSNIGNESNNSVVIGAQQQSVGSGVRTQQSIANIIGSGSNNNSSASGIIIANQVSGSSVNSGTANTYIHQALGGVVVTGTAAVASAGLTVGPVGSSVPVSPTARKRLKLEQSPIVDVEHDIATLKKLILEHKYMRLRSIKEK